MNKFTVAVLQMDSQDDVQANLDTAVAFIEEAAARGARLITMPESMNYVGLDNAGHAEEIPGGPTFQLMAEQATMRSCFRYSRTLSALMPPVGINFKPP